MQRQLDLTHDTYKLWHLTKTFTMERTPPNSIKMVVIIKIQYMYINIDYSIDILHGVSAPSF